MVINLNDRSVGRQGGYFFIFLITSIKAIKTIAYVSKNIMSVIFEYSPPFTRELEQPPPFLYYVIVSYLL